MHMWEQESITQYKYNIKGSVTALSSPQAVTTSRQHTFFLLKCNDPGSSRYSRLLLQTFRCSQSCCGNFHFQFSKITHTLFFFYRCIALQDFGSPHLQGTTAPIVRNHILSCAACPMAFWPVLYCSSACHRPGFDPKPRHYQIRKHWEVGDSQLVTTKLGKQMANSESV